MSVDDLRSQRDDERRRVERRGGGARTRAVAPIPDEILTSAEARQLLKIGRTKLWELICEQLIPAYRVGSGSRSELRFKRSELLAWLDRNRV